MKIYLIDPIYLVYRDYLGLGILAIANACLEIGWDVVIADKNSGLSSPRGYYSCLEKELRQYKPDVIGFTTRCDIYPFAVGVAGYLKGKFPETPIIFGGPQATHTDVETLRNSMVDIIVRGEGEATIKKLLQAVADKTSFQGIQGVTYKRTPKDIARNPDRLPSRATNYSMNFKPVPKGYADILKTAGVYHLEAGRGCPYQCTFCSTSAMWCRKYSIRKAPDIYEAMKMINQKFSISLFCLEHDSIMAGANFDRFLEEMCMLNTEKFKWTCSARIDNFSTGMVDKLVKAGCFRVYFGIETGSARMQKLYKKNLKINECVAKLEEILADGRLQVMLSFIYGHPLEDYEDIERTLDLIARFAQHKSCITIQFHKISPTSGSELYNDYRDDLKYTDDISDQAYNEEIVKLYSQDITSNKELYSSFYSFTNSLIPDAVMRKIGNEWYTWCRYYSRTLLCAKYAFSVGTLALFSLLEMNGIGMSEIQTLYKKSNVPAPRLLEDYLEFERGMEECLSAKVSGPGARRNGEGTIVNPSLRTVSIRFNVGQPLSGEQLYHQTPNSEYTDMLIWKDNLGTLYYKKKSPLDQIILTAKDVASLKANIQLKEYIAQMEGRSLIFTA